MTLDGRDSEGIRSGRPIPSPRSSHELVPVYFSTAGSGGSREARFCESRPRPYQAGM